MGNKKVCLPILLTKVLAVYVILGGYFSAFSMQQKNPQENVCKRKYEAISQDGDNEGNNGHESNEEILISGQHDDENKSKKLKMSQGDDNQASPQRNREKNKETPTPSKCNKRLFSELDNNNDNNKEEQDEKNIENSAKKYCVRNDASDEGLIPGGDSMSLIESSLEFPLEEPSPAWAMGGLKQNLAESVHDENFFSNIETKVKEIDSQLDMELLSSEPDIKNLHIMLNEFFGLNKSYTQVLTKKVPSQDMYRLFKKYNELLAKQLNCFVDSCNELLAKQLNCSVDSCVDEKLKSIKKLESIEKIKSNEKYLENFSWPNLLQKLHDSGRYGAVLYIVHKLSEPKMADKNIKITNYTAVENLIESLTKKELYYYLTLLNKQRVEYRKEVAPFAFNTPYENGLYVDQIALYEAYQKMLPLLHSSLLLTFGSWKKVLYIAIEQDLGNPVVADILRNIGWGVGDSIPLLTQAFKDAVLGKKTIFIAACKEYQRLVSEYTRHFSRHLPQEIIRNIVMFNLKAHEAETELIENGKNMELLL